MVSHAAKKHGVALPETACKRRAALVPFARAECPVVRFPEDFRERAHGIQIVVDAEQAAPAHQHRPAGCADGPVVGAHVVGSPERVPILDEANQVRGTDISVAVRTDGVGLQIVGEEKQDVRGGSVRSGIHRTGRGEAGKESKNAEAQKEAIHVIMRAGLEKGVFLVRNVGSSKISFSGTCGEPRCRV